MKEISEGTYEYPPDMDSHTLMLFEEVAGIFAETSEDIIASFVTTKDSQDWWLTLDENTQLLKSGAYFGHYKVPVHIKYHSALHVEKLNLKLQTGVPLKR